jgi:hypothetical protein
MREEALEKKRRERQEIEAKREREKAASVWAAKPATNLP